jgi:hypothetical protein
MHEHSERAKCDDVRKQQARHTKQRARTRKNGVHDTRTTRSQHDDEREQRDDGERNTREQLNRRHIYLKQILVKSI